MKIDKDIYFNRVYILQFITSISNVINTIILFIINEYL